MIHLIAVSLVLSAAPAAAATELPKVIHRADSEIKKPLWVSVDAAFADDGRLKPSVFPNATSPLNSGSRAGVEAAADATATTFEFLRHEDCSTVWGGTVGGSKPDRELTDLFEHATAVYHGRVTHVTYGFYDGMPGALLRADVIGAPRPGRVNTVDGLLVFYNYARFQSGGEKYCAGFRAPRIGEEFLVFAYYAPADANRSIIDANNRIFFRLPGGEVEATPSWAHRLRLGDRAVKSFHELRDAAAAWHDAKDRRR